MTYRKQRKRPFSQTRRMFRLLRTNAGLTQIEVSVKAKVTYGRYRDIENGFAQPTGDEIEALKKVFKVEALDVQAIAS